MSDAEDSLEEALPLLDRLVLWMLDERGFAPLDPSLTTATILRS